MKWQNVFKEEKLVKTTSTTLAIFDGSKITPSTLQLDLSYMVALYILDAYEKYSYQLMSKLINLYYETTPPYGQTKYKETALHGNYKNKSHRYSTNAREGVEGDIVLYHNSKISHAVEKAFKDLDDQCASNIWKSLMPHFRTKIKNQFDEQSTSARYLCIGNKENQTNVIQMHISKNSYIKPHIDMNDLESSIITWFSEGEPRGAEFGLFQMLYKFKINNGSGLFVKSQEYVHGTLELDTKGDELQNYTLGVALTNKKGLITRSTNQLNANTKNPIGVPSSKHWCTIDPRHIVE